MSLAQRTKAEALRAYERTHWGHRGPVDWRELRVPDPADGIPVELGRLERIAYVTRKGRDRELVEYEHAFGEPAPFLCFVPSGLLIVGGNYRVTERGIVG